MIVKVSGFCIAGLLVTTSASAAAPHVSAPATPDELLGAATEAIQQDSYRGVVVNSRAGRLKTLRIYHRYQDDEQQQRLVSMNGPNREIIRTGPKLVSILPGKELVLISRQRRKGLLNQVTQFSVERLRSSYQLTRDGTGRVAGRQSRRVKITPDDKYRYGYRLSLDETTRLPLKLELVNKDRVLERLLFTQVHFDDSMSDQLLESQYDVKGYRVMKHRSMESMDQLKTSVQWQASGLPPGFERIKTEIRQVSDKSEVRQILYSDGVASVSAFIAPAGLRAPLKGGSSLGPVNAFGRKDGDNQITVVGEVPKATVKLIAGKLHRKNPSRSQG